MSRLTAKRGFLVGLTAVFLVAAQPAQQAAVDADVSDLQAQIDALEARVEALEALAAADPSVAPTPTVTPTVRPTATPVATPTATPAATKTPAPTSTPAPTATPKPTSTPAPTATPAPTPKATTAPTKAPAADNILGVDFSKLPTSGSAWSTVKSWADKSISSPDMSDQDDPDNVVTLAAALVYKKTGQATYRSKVISALKKVRGTDDGRNLAAGRELAAYVIAADLVKATSSDLGYDFKAELRSILSRIRHDEHGDRTLVKTAEQQGNNWGTHAQGSLAAAYAYLGDRAGLDHTAAIVKGFMGDKNAWNGWNYKQSMSWSVGGAPINPKGATIKGHNVDGVIQQDQVRAGSFSWPPPCENYTWEALQGLTLAAHLLSVQGYPAWSWQDSAVKRSMDWLYGVAKCPATGDDTATPWLVNKAYGTKYPTGSTRPGKNFGFSDWLFGG